MTELVERNACLLPGTRPETPRDAQSPDTPSRYGILASSVAGRRISVDAAEPGEPTWTDGVTIFVDPALKPGQASCAVAVQAALIGAGSLDGDHVSRLGRKVGLVPRFVSVEVHRALAEHLPFLPPPVAVFLDRETAAKTSTPAESLAIAESREPLGPPPALFGTIRPREIRPDFSSGGTAGGISSAAIAGALTQPDADELDDERGPALDLDLLSGPSGRGGPIGRLLQRLLMSGQQSSGEAGGPPGMELPAQWSRRPRAGRDTFVRGAAPDVPGELDSAQPRRMSYPEWDVHQGRYRPGWCTVTELSGDAISPGAPVVTETWQLRRALARLGADRVRMRRQLQGDELDIDAAVEARAQLNAGTAPDEALFLDDLRVRHDLSVLILLDVSGSAAEMSASGVTVHEHQTKAAAALASTLFDLGNRVSLAAFRSQGRTNVEVQTVMRFGERMDARVLRRLGGLNPGAYTRLGAAIRHGAAMLDENGSTTRRLLVVISDGFAYDHGYEGAYGEGDAQRALSEARTLGIGCLCLTVGATTDDDTLSRVFGTAAQGSIAKPEDLPPIAARLVQTALATAGASRRSA